jgi:peroxiredoxin
MKNTLAAVAMLALIALAATAVACPPSPEAEAQAEAQAAPGFTVKDLSGSDLTLAGYKGKVLVLNFWATWCPPCRKEIPDFIEAYRELKGQGLEILGLSVDDMTAQALLDWTSKMGVNYPIALATPEVIRDYEPGQYIPATIIVDRAGRLRYRHTGLMDKATLLRLFQQYQ